MAEPLTLREKQQSEDAAIEKQRQHILTETDRLIKRFRLVHDASCELVDLISNTRELPNEIYSKAIELNYILKATL